MHKWRHLLSVVCFTCALVWAAPAAGERVPMAADEVALLQGMLLAVKSPAGRPYVQFRVDGEFGPGTRAALAAFQRDRGIDEGLPLRDGPTWRALREALPEAFRGMRVLPESKILYFEATADEAARSMAQIESYSEFEPSFQRQVMDMVRRMYEEYGIVLWITYTGWRRGFGDQLGFGRRNTMAGPGESTHHYGRACDLGFRGFRWMDATGAIWRDGDWLERMSRALGPASWRLWKARDGIAFSLGLYKIAWEGVHLQALEDERISNAQSLVRLLEKTGTMRWETRPVGGRAYYWSDLGRGEGMYPVGTAREIWTGRAPVPAAAGDVTALRRALRAEFEKAEQNWRLWEPVSAN